MAGAQEAKEESERKARIIAQAGRDNAQMAGEMAQLARVNARMARKKGEMEAPAV